MVMGYYLIYVCFNELKFTMMFLTTTMYTVSCCIDARLIYKRVVCASNKNFNRFYFFVAE